MKTKVQIENGWIKFSDDIAEEYKMDKKKSLQLRDEIAKEYMLFFSVGIKEEEIKKRIAKYERLYENANIEVTKFDPYWSYRLAFLRWILE